MAVHKAIRSNPQAQPLRNRPNPQPQHSQAKDPQLKSELFEALRHLNRGFGVALSSLDPCSGKTAHRRRASFPLASCWRTATVLKSFALWPTATSFASSPDAKSRTPSALAGSALSLKNQAASVAAPDHH